ncbi:hypothetical protein AB833_24965 [Chromatiales bacterium (ex Bugula neritina AB1)]|nr:hypothetical protein AB833_24965 [Chromatiales bacterium (ex Bugula neritina AB1)]
MADTNMILKLRLVPYVRIALAIILLSATLGRAANAPAVVEPDELGGIERYLAYVSTDKPVYREGESVYLRTVILSAIDNTPLAERGNSIQVKITGPKGDVVHEGHSNSTDSAFGYQWVVPAGIAGGEYTAKVSSSTLGVPETERAFDIRAFRAPRIKTQIQFTRDGYGPGDLVKASVSVERAEGGVPLKASVTAIARLDGREIYRATDLKIMGSGIVETAFNLPEQISAGEGSLSFVIEDGGVVETASKSLPVLLRKLDISFYPESGELVAGLKSRVYFQALLANGKPADVQGKIVEIDGGIPGNTTLAEFESEHEGRGLFVITPEKGKRYAAVFTAPSGITHPAELPSVQNTGTVITSSRPAFAFDNSIEISVATATQESPVRLTLHKREALLDSQDNITGLVTLDARDAEGVLIVTAWDRNGRPLAERLIFRQPRFGLNVELQLSDGPYVPGTDISVDILTTDDQGKPVEAVVGLTVTDDAVLELIEKRQQAPRLPVMVYLENEVLDLADAHVYLDRSDMHADTAVDLLLGTQGWRRFVLVDYSDIKKQFPSQIKRAMAENDQPKPVFRRMERRQIAMEGVMLLNAPMAAVQMEVVAEEMAPRPVNDAEPLVAAMPPPPPAPPPPVDDLQKNKALEMPVAEIAEAEQAFEVAGKIMAADMVMAAPANVGYIREFAFKARPDRQANERIDFTETLYWNTGVKTGARDGRATVEFSLSDSVTTFRLLADAYGRNGALGAGEAVIASVEPFYITAKMPLHAIAADVIRLPVTMVNSSDKTIENASLAIAGEGISDKKQAPVTLAPGQRLRSLIEVVTTKAGSFPITVTAQAGPYRDTVTRNLTVRPAGFPVTANEGGLLSSKAPFSTTVTIPADVSAGSLTATVKVYPSPLASMEEALNALLREPHGCFEQTSSTNYPLVMAQQYFDSHTGVDPKKIAQSRELLKAGYSKLIGFESEDNGYEWFGANPAHEALTAYGLMEFTDMAKVMQIDNTMLERTRQWLLDRRDGNGGFKRNERALDSFGRAPAPTTNAYIVWSLLESGQSPNSLKMEIDQVKDRAFRGDDSYIIALATNILYLSGDTASAELLAKRLVAAANDAGAIDGAATSITGSGGDSLTIETTSLALLAWLRDDEQWAAQVEKSIKWLFERSKAGRFGSTQSTVLALKAINTYDAARAVPKRPGSVHLYINGEVFGEPVAFTRESKGAIELADFSGVLAAGQNRIELRMTDGSKMPFALEISYNTSLPVTAASTPVHLSTELSHVKITEGEPLELQATVTAHGNNVATPIAIIGIPAGLELRHEQLKELVGQGSISAYEVRDSALVLYWRALKANESRVIPVSLVAVTPGVFSAPASRIYPYYTDELKLWEAGHSIVVAGR